MSGPHDMRVRISPDGPYLVTGGPPLAKYDIVTDDEGESAAWEMGEELHRHEHYALCRCGSSRSKPFCDGTHTVIGFDGAETADRAPYAEASETLFGPVVGLQDAVALCADTRFCHRRRIWGLVGHAEAPDAVTDVRRGAELCPSGRYTAVDSETGAPFEPELPASIALVEDPHENVSGPIWVRGGIPIQSADGTEYEVRNRVTLCRCGGSRNKPFCDGSHLEIGFKAE
ncbi:MAG: CDGSH iron-sulfur domain-containing protein [Coriobacteriia bacterium]|nr:CDGSH iron-sulfur domain-containing protein [Coriobacteriia bacterium]